MTTSGVASTFLYNRRMKLVRCIHFTTAIQNSLIAVKPLRVISVPGCCSEKLPRTKDNCDIDTNLMVFPPFKAMRIICFK